MSVESDNRGDEKRHNVLESTPQVQIFLKPIAPPAALGLAGFAGSTFITSSYIANWWGGPESPTIFFPFVGIFGGLAQFIAGIKASSCLSNAYVEYLLTRSDRVSMRVIHWSRSLTLYGGVFGLQSEFCTRSW